MNQIVLLVDDEPEVIDGLKRALHKEPYELLCAHSGREAIEILSTHQVDVIISDEEMPGMGGSDLLGYARRNHPKTVRIMLTGKASVESAMKAIYDGWVYQYLHKPCNPIDLASAIYNGLLLQSLQMKDENPHVILSDEQQTELLQRVAEKDVSDNL